MSEKRSSQGEKSNKRITGRILSRLGRTAASGNRATDPAGIVTSEILSPKRIRELSDALRLGKSSSDSLGRDRRAEYKGMVQEAALATHELADGRKNILTHLLIMGDSVLGVDSILGSDGSVQETAVRVLPIGKQVPEFRFRATAATLLSFNPEDASKPGNNGVVKAWEEIEVGRRDIKGAYGIEDPAISRPHAKIGLTAQGQFSVRDLSSENGTEVITLNRLSRSVTGQQAIGLGSALATMLQAQPYMWASEYAGRHYSEG